MLLNNQHVKSASSGPNINKDQNISLMQTEWKAAGILQSKVLLLLQMSTYHSSNFKLQNHQTIVQASLNDAI